MAIQRSIHRKAKSSSKPRDTHTATLLLRHFGKMDPQHLCVAERLFPFRVRADLQRAIERVIEKDAQTNVRHFCGVRQAYSLEGIEFSALMVHNEHNPPVAVPPQYEEVDIGEETPVRCLKQGLWLLEQEGTRFAVLVAQALQHGQPEGMRIQLATPNDAQGARIADHFFRVLEKAVNDSRSYRGKILSLEKRRNYSGRSTGIKVHRLRAVDRRQVILPSKTLALLDRNVIQFVERRDELSAQGQATKKGILFYGPPGTGKSHTIHYLAGALQGHTMLLIAAEQIELLGEYMALARLLQPSVVVIEDVDLIARDREAMGSSSQEARLNSLLNEMDGLKESADILFILTTNRPQALEAALSSRPGRVDQAIEFPLPDEKSREKLVRLYAGGTEISDDLVRLIVSRTEKVSAAFVKELIRRSVQFRLEHDGTGGLEKQDVENALDEMLFSGGSLNVKLLGGNVGGSGRVGFV